jgi:hypothetical protein
MFNNVWVLYQTEYYAYDMSELSLGEFASMYVDCLIHNPLATAKSILYRVHAYWVINASNPINCVNYVEIYDFFEKSHVGSQFPEIGVYRQSNILTNIMDDYISIMDMQLPATFIWRYGIWSALIIASLMITIMHKQYIGLLVYVPVMIYLVSLYLTNGWTDYRYGLPVFYVGLFIPFASLSLINQKASRKNCSRLNF